MNVPVLVYKNTNFIRPSQPYIMLRYVSLFFFSPSNLEVAWPIVTKFCHVFGSECYLQTHTSTLGGPSSKKIWRTKNMKIMAQFQTTSKLEREYLDQNKI